MKAKKTYTTPQLKSQKVELGVFGDYGTQPIKPIRDDTIPWFPGGSRNRME